MSGEPPVTVLLATYNGERFLKQQLDSLFAQTYGNWRLLASDDGSTDRTRYILEEYQRRFSGRFNILENVEMPGGACANFLHLMRNYSGYAMFCDQDDVWKNNKIAAAMYAMGKLEREKGADKPLLVFTDLEVVDENLNILSPSFLKYSGLDGRRTSLNRLLIQNVVTGCTALINEPLRKLALNVGDESAVLMHDWWAALVAAAVGHIAFIDSSAVRYRQHSRNAVGAKDTHGLRYALNKIGAGKDVRRSLRDTMRQAGQLVKCCGDFMEPEAQALVRGYANLPEQCKAARIVFMIRHRILKQGVMRKAAQIIWG